MLFKNLKYLNLNKKYRKIISINTIDISVNKGPEIKKIGNKTIK